MGYQSEVHCQDSAYVCCLTHDEEKCELASVQYMWMCIYSNVSHGSVLHADMYILGVGRLLSETCVPSYKTVCN